MDYRNRRGKFVLSYHYLEDTPWNELRQVMADMIVMQTESNYATNTVTYWACHPSFDEVSRYETCPEYTIETSYAWKRK